MLLNDIKQSIQESLKQHDTNKVSTLRMLLSAVRYAAIKQYGAEGEAKLTDADIVTVIQKQVKERKESIEAYTNAGRHELAQKEQQELAVLQAYLPAELTDTELEQIIKTVIASGQTNFGMVMKQVVSATQGRADGNRIAAQVKRLLV